MATHAAIDFARDTRRPRGGPLLNVAHRRAPVVLVADVPREGHDVPAEAPAAELARKVKARHGERGAGRDLKPAALLHNPA